MYQKQLQYELMKTVRMRWQIWCSETSTVSGFRGGLVQFVRVALLCLS